MRMRVFLLAAMLAAGSSLASGSEMSDTEKMAAGLREKVEAEGVVRVIVEVQPSDPSSRAATDGTARGVCENVECARLLVEQVLTARMASNVKEVSDRLLAMDVTPEGLNALEQMPLVRRISPDVPSPPTPIEEKGSDGNAGPPDGVEPQPDGLPPDLSAPQ